MQSSPEILKVLENESIEHFRESAAAFQKPVMLYSIGKDSSVLLHLARKAFSPGQFHSRFCILTQLGSFGK